MTDLISRADALAMLDDMKKEGIIDEYDVHWVGKWLNKLPSADAVEVVRCKDCKHWLQHTQFGYDEENEVYDDYCEFFTPEDDFYAMPTNENDFCSYGERRKP